VWAGLDRVATPGDPVYTDAVLVSELVALLDAPGVESPTATSGFMPNVRLQ